MAVISCIALTAVVSTQFMFNPLNYSNLEHIITLNYSSLVLLASATIASTEKQIQHVETFYVNCDHCKCW
uniref:PGG domain-containing protein n=1 Tax=Setaria italica TaxID=4555 RepID=K3ZGM8_SETIT